MNILLLGSGGREHALAWRIAHSPQCDKLFIAPGNPGMTSLGKCLDTLSATDFPAIADCVRTESIDLLVVGPEEPLVKGIVDYFRQTEDLAHLPIVGPDASGARLEGSKDFSKAFMLRNEIPTARYSSFRGEQLLEAKAYLRTLNAPYVLKADGLAAGKGVIIAESLEEADAELEAMLSGKFGEASACVVIEEFLKGIECSVFVASDGKDYRILPVAKDYKRIGEGDTGPNTGGMGSVSPVSFADRTFMSKVEERIIKPTMAGLNAEGIDYRGFIFIGLMSVDGEPYVIEYNCRMGDPETESVMLRIKSDFVELLMRMGKGQLGDYELIEDGRVATTVVMVSEGYPGDYTKGIEITLPQSIASEQVLFHAGTKLQSGLLVTNGGRVLTASCYGTSIQEALASSYDLVNRVCFSGKNFRKDIGQDLLNLSKE